MSKTLFKGDAAPFVMELPPYHIPTFKGILLRAWERLKAFITKAGKMIVIMVVILGMMNSVGVDGSIGKKDTQDSILSALSRSVTPVFAPMGIRQENWPATVGLMTGVFAKEVMVGSMDAIYTSLGAKETAASGEPPPKYDFWNGMGKAFASVPTNLGELGSQIFDPLKLNSLNDIGSQKTAATAQKVHATVYGQMATRFGSSSAAIAYLLFVLLYFPCVSATSAVYRETNLGWTIFVGCWTTGIAYWVSVFYYQLMTFSEHPGSSIGWFVGLAVAMLGTLFGLKRFGDSNQIKTRPEVTQKSLTTR